MTDADLLDAYRATRDRRVLDDLFTRHYPIVYHVVLKLVRDATDASDLTQSTFLKAVESAERVRAEGSLRNWLLTIAVNEVRQFRRSAARRNRPEALRELTRKGAPGRLGASDPLQREFEEQLEQALLQFPDDLKDPLVLHYYQHLSYAEVAQILGIPKSTVQFRMEQALEELRSRLKKRELLALLPTFFPKSRAGRTLSWGATIMNVKILASSVLLCSLLVAGGVAWRASSRPGSGSRPTPERASVRGAAAGATGREASSATTAAHGIFGRVIDRETETPLADASVSAYDFERRTTDRTVSDDAGAFRLPSSQTSSATFHLKISRPGYAALSAEGVSASSSGLVFKMARGGGVTGRVQDADGIPVVPYRILAVRKQFGNGPLPSQSRQLYQLALPDEFVAEEGQTTVQPDGRFDMNHLSPGTYVLVVRSPGAYPFCYPTERYPSDKWCIEVKEGSTQEVVIVRPKAGALRAHVLDRETREPVAGARILSLSWIDGFQLSLEGTPARTDGSGFCDLPISLSKYGGLDTTNLRIEKEGYAPQRLSFSGQPDGYVLEVELARPARIRGHVRTRDGAPIAGAAVYVQRDMDGWVAGLAFTDADGAYGVEDLDGPHDYSVFAYERRLQTSRSTRSILLRAGETRELDFGADTGAGVRGTVKRHGKPVPNAHVWLEASDEAPGVSCVVNNAGAYEMEGVAPGAYKVFVNVSDADPRIYIYDHLVLGKNERKIQNFDLGGYRIRGTACDAATLLPLRPQEGAEVLARLVGETGDVGVSTYTREEGRFELEVARPGLYELTVRDNSPCTVQDPPRVDLTTATSVDDVRLLLTWDDHAGRVSIRVLDARSGEPIPTGWYQYKASGGRSGAGYFDKARITTDEAARGSYQYEVGSDEHVPVRLTLDVTADHPEAEATIRLVESEAVHVKRVLPSSAAEKAGLLTDDLLLSYDGSPLRAVGVLKSLAGQVPPTQKVALEVRRCGERRVLVVPGGTLGIEIENAPLH